MGADKGLLDGLGSGSGLLWAVLGPDQGLSDGLGSGSGPTWAVLGADHGLSWRSWERIRAYLTVLGADQGPPGRSWGRIRAYVGGLGSGSGPKLAVLGPMLAVLGEKWPKPKRESDLASGSRPKSGPNPSGKAVLGRGRFSIVFGRRSAERIFSIDISSCMWRLVTSRL